MRPFWLRARGRAIFALIFLASSAFAGVEGPVLYEAEFTASSILLVVPADLDAASLAVEVMASHWEAVSQPVQPEGDDWGEFRGWHGYRGYRLGALAVRPWRHEVNPATGRVERRVLDRYRVRPAEPGGGLPVLLRRERAVPGEAQAVEARLRDLVANPDDLPACRRGAELLGEAAGAPFQPRSRPSAEGSAVRYLIVTSEELASEFERLAAYRTAQGLPALVVTRDDVLAYGRHGMDFQETLRLYLQDAYEFWGTQYVLLGGDTDILPTRYVRSYLNPIGGHTDLPTDLYFAALDGTWNGDGDAWLCEPYNGVSDPGDDADLVPDVGVGRAPVSTPALAAGFVDKVLGYENADSQASWAQRALFLAEVLFPADWQPGDDITLDGAAFAQETIDGSVDACSEAGATTLFEASAFWPGSLPLTLSAAIDSLDSGRYGIVNPVAHGNFFGLSLGTGELRTADADDLTNPHHFLVHSLSCETGAFDQACLLERLVQNPVGGAIAAVGTARLAYPATGNEFQQEFFRQLYCENRNGLADAVALSFLPFLGDLWFENGTRWSVINLVTLGDPALAIWTREPRAVSVRGPATIPAGPHDVLIRVATAQGIPIDGALVCLVKDGETYDAGTTDAAGRATLRSCATSGGAVEVVVTGPDLERTVVAVPVAMPVTYLTVASHGLLDRPLGQTSGNGNLIVEAGETVSLLITLRDTGGAGAIGVQVQLSTETAGVTPVVDTVWVAAVPPGGVGAAGRKFILDIAPDVPDGTIVECVLTARDATGGTYTSSFEIPIHAPRLEPTDVAWEDGTHGDGDGAIEAGETIVFGVTAKNYGGGVLDACEIRLRSDDPTVTVVDSVCALPSLAPQAEGTASPALAATFAQAPAPHACRLVLTDNHGRTQVLPLDLARPAAPAGLAGGQETTPDAVVLRWYPVAGASGYQVWRAAGGSGDFVRADDDLVRGATFFEDVGLAGLQSYRFRVAAVNSSLVAGPPSPAITFLTSPVELAGFPRPYDLESSSHCAVGDVTGDGRLEIVLAADEIYVWDDTGQELFDGDDNPSTQGPITDLDGRFEPAGVALGELDDEPGLEIVVSNREGGHRIFALRSDGTVLPGWPQTLNYWNWATPAVGDVDGDGDHEIVVQTLNGRTYAWHHDGTEVRNGDGNPNTNGVFAVESNVGWTYVAPTLVDLDGDGARDIVIVTDRGDNQNAVRAYRHDGTSVAGFPYSLGYRRAISSPAVADLEGDGLLDIVFITRDHYLYAVRQDGTLRTGFPVLRGAPADVSAGASPALGDLDGDGRLEIVWVVNGGANRCDVVVTDAGGATRPGWPVILPGNSESSPVIGDIDGDHVPDIVFGIGGTTGVANNLYAWRADGGGITGFPLELDGFIRAAPVITDLDGDGDVDLVLGAWDRLLHVWDLPGAFDPAATPWPTFRGSMQRHGEFVPDPAGLKAAVTAPVPGALTVRPPWPNPFNPATAIAFYNPREGEVTLSVFDLRGRRVRALRRGPLPAGWHAVEWDGHDDRGGALASGVYLLRATAGAEAATQRLTLLR